MRKSSFVIIVLCVIALQASYAETPKSWKQTAMDALYAGDYAKATQYLKKWVEADPTDAVSLYNLACCYAIDKKTDEAMKTLQAAVVAGWSDSAHTEEDTDLKPLHEQKDFKKILRDIAHNAATRSGGFITNTAPQPRLGNYLVILPDEYDGTTHYPLVVLLHGYGQSAKLFTEVVPMINSHDFIYIIPEAAYPVLDSGGKGFSHLREFDDFKEDTASIAGAAQWVVNAADDAIKRYPVDGNKFWVVGFSQGAALAHVVAARFPDRVAGYAAHGGYLIKGQFSDFQFDMEKQNNVHVLITHGKEDPSVPVMEGMYAANLLSRAGVDVSFEQMDVPHVFLPEVGAKVNDWLKAKIEKAKNGN
jgi:phospholipase/carboxylesterase